MNKLAVDRSARAQKGQNVDMCCNSNNGLMALHEIATDTKVGPVEFYSGQDRQTDTHRHTGMLGNPRSAQSQLWQTIK